MTKRLLRHDTLPPGLPLYIGDTEGDKVNSSDFISVILFIYLYKAQEKACGATTDLSSSWFTGE